MRVVWLGLLVSGLASWLVAIRSSFVRRRRPAGTAASKQVRLVMTGTRRTLTVAATPVRSPAAATP